MRHAWIANDGTVFESETECREYERESFGLFMFCEGKETANPEEADVVLVKNEDTYWNRVHGNDDFPGVNGPGWHVWNDTGERYLAWDDIKELYDTYKFFIDAKENEGLEPTWD